MPYVLHCADGRITSVHRTPVPHATWLAPDDPALTAFWSDLSAPSEPADLDQTDAFPALDAGFIRVLEDLVDVLVARRLINLTDLPIEAQHKLFERKHLREHHQHRALQLYDDMAGLPDAETLPTALLFDRL